MKKRARKKKSSKRVASKKSKKGAWKPKPAHHIVVLEPLSGPDYVPNLKMSRGDKLRWENRDNVKHTLSFTIWIFKESKRDIQVRVNGQSRWFTVKSDTTPRTYSYSPDPPFPNQGPPDPPEVVAEP